MAGLFMLFTGAHENEDTGNLLAGF